MVYFCIAAIENRMRIARGQVLKIDVNRCKNATRMDISDWAFGFRISRFYLSAKSRRNCSVSATPSFTAYAKADRSQHLCTAEFDSETCSLALLP
eukprot:IDg2930t1